MKPLFISTLLLVAALVLHARPQFLRPDAVAGPSAVAVVGDVLFVVDAFGTAIRQIDLRSGAMNDVAMAPHDSIFGMEADGGRGLLVRNGPHLSRLDPRTGRFTLLAGARYGAGDGDGLATKAEFFFGSGIGHDARGNVFVNDGARNIRRVDPLRDRVSTMTDDGWKDRLPAGAGSVWDDAFIEDVTSDAAGNLFVSTGGDFASEQRIWRIAARSRATTTLVGPGTQLQHDPLVGGHSWRGQDMDALATDGHGGLIFLNRVAGFVLKANVTSGRVEWIAGHGLGVARDGPASVAAFADPQDVTVDAAGNIYVADYDAQRIARIDAVTHDVRTLAHVGGARREAGLRDWVGTSPEPTDMRCDNGYGPGIVAIRVVDASARPVAGVFVNRIGRLSELIGVTDTNGHLAVVVARADNYRLMATRRGSDSAALEFGMGRSCTGTRTVVMKANAPR